MKKLVYVILALVMTFSMVMPLFAQTPAEPQPPNLKPQTVYQWDYPPAFNNVTVNVVGDAGHNLAPYTFWKDDFTKAGITISTIEAPFEGVYEKEMTEFIAGSGAFDLVTFYPAYIGDFAGNGYLEPLDDYIAKQPAGVYDPKMDDILAPFHQLYCMFGGKTYAMAIDGDVLLLQWRKDLMANADEQAAFKAKYNKELKAPETWDDWLQVSQFFTRKKGEKLAGQVLDHDFYGSAEYGARGFSVYWYLNRFASAGGMYFDENMKPGIDTPAAVAALQNMVDSLKSSPPDTMAYGYDQLRDVFLKGYVAMVIQWSDVPKKAEDPAVSSITGDKVGVGRVPGTMGPDGTVVHRSLMPVGRVVAVAKDSQNKDAAYWVGKHISYDRSLDDVATVLTGLDPYRTSHFQHPEAFTMFGSPQQAQDYLNGVQAGLADGFPEIFIPGAAAYTDALDVQVQKALTGEAKPADALAAAAKDWDAITDKLGRDKQIKLWQQALMSYKSLGLIK